jgi:hypothetical protein
VFPGTTTIDPRFVDPRINFFDPRLQFNGGSLGFTPGSTTGNTFIPANGDGFFFHNPWGYSGPMVDARGAWAQRGGPAFGGTVPVAGLNSPPVGRGSARVTRIVDGGSGSGYDYASLAVADALTGNDLPRPAGGVIDPGVVPTRVSVRGGTTVVRTQPIAPTHVAVGTVRTPPTVQVFEPSIPTRTAVAGSRTVYRTTENVVNVAEVNPQQIRLADHMEDVMENRPLTEGTVISLHDRDVVVRYLSRGVVTVERFPMGNVFFFHNGGTLATASTGGRMLQPGDEVLIPLPTTVSIERQSVAGSRQEINGSTRVRVRRAPARRPAK